MGLYNRLGLSFDTSQFGSAQTLAPNAANTLNLIASSSGSIPEWQKTDLAAGSPVRTNYFKNPTVNTLSTMTVATNTLLSAANSANDFVTVGVASTLLIELSKFKSHTDNISGVVAVSNVSFPSLQSAQNIGQLNMMTLSKTDGVSNTAPILGSFTSLFIQDQLNANANEIIFFADEYKNSINLTSYTDEFGNTYTTYTSNLPNTEIVKIQSYLSNTQNLMANRRTNDWSFYQNSVQLAQDVGFMQQFNGMGGTMSYLVNNVVGTPNLLSKLNS